MAAASLVRLALIVSVGLGCSCSAPLDYARLRDHVVLANEDGRIVTLDTQMPQSHVDARHRILKMLDAAEERRDADDPEARKEGKPLQLLVYVHGGLNSYDASLAQAEAVVSRMARESGGDRHYPIVLCWPSGAVDSYWEHVWRLRLGHHEWWGPWTSPFVLVADVASGLAKAVYTIPLQLIMDGCNAGEIAFDRPLTPESVGSAAIYEAMTASAGPHDPPSAVRVGKGRFSRGALTQAWRATTWLLLQPIKLASLPLCDGLGNGAWKVMLRRTHNLHRPASTLDAARLHDHPDEMRRSLNLEPSGAAAELFDAIQDWCQDREVRVTLVGHSMGAIVLNSVLSTQTDHDAGVGGRAPILAAAGPAPLRFPAPARRPLPIRDIVYMAPACSILETERNVVPYLQHNSEATFHVLTLHPLAEFSERNWDLVPRGSLLAWIEYWYASAAGHADRRLGIWDSVIQALAIFKPVASRVTIKAFGVQGDSLPQRHGDFNDCPFWRRSFWDPAVLDLYDEEWWRGIRPKRRR